MIKINKNDKEYNYFVESCPSYFKYMLKEVAEKNQNYLKKFENIAKFIFY